MRVTINQEYIDSLTTPRGGYTRRGTKLMGVAWPLASGWRRNLIGKVVEVDPAELDAEREKIKQTADDIAKQKRAMELPVFDGCRACRTLEQAGFSVQYDRQSDMLFVFHSQGKLTKISGDSLR